MFNIGNRVVPNILVSCDHGLMLVNRFDNIGYSIGSTLLNHGNNNTVEADVTFKVLENVSNPVIFDVGANIGTYANWVARWSRDRDGTVYCFEPQRTVFQMLCGNMAINNIFNVYAYQIGLGKEEAEIDIPEVDYYVPESNFGAFSIDGIDRKQYKNISGKYQKIKISTIDKFMIDNDIEKVDFIKIDAEGLDIDVIEGGLETIKRYKPDLLVEYINLGSSKDEDTCEEGKQILIDYLRDLGYNIHVVGIEILATTKNLK